MADSNDFDVIVLGSVFVTEKYRAPEFWLDTSCFPSIGAVNPAWTAIANGPWVADRLLK